MSVQAKINFSLRPAKYTERRMLVDFFSHLNAFDKVSKYQYIGFGSYYFADFALFHKQLGFKSMINIERDGVNQERYKFNSPYGSIRHIFKQSIDALRDIDLSKSKNILWLDYLCSLNGDCLRDVEHFCKNTQSGSVLLVTVNGRIDLSKKEAEANFLGSIDRPLLTRPKASLAGDGFRKECINIMRRKIESVLIERSGNVGQEKFKFRPVINIVYSDGSEMLTYGGIIYSESDAEVAESNIFSDLEYARESEESFEIKYPILTYKEIKYIDSIIGHQELYDASNMEKSFKPIPKSEVEKYLSLYRFCPNFAHVDTW